MKILPHPPRRRGRLPVTLLALLSAGRLAAAEPFTFAAMGCLPYGRHPGSAEAFERVIAEINRQSPAFAVHLGDILGSDERCTDELLLRRRDQFDSVTTALVYTPGDNEWTDTHSEKAGRFEPRERLARIRELFFAEERSRGRSPRPLITQRRDPAYRRFVENARWTVGGVMFATVHVVGSHNNHQPKVPGAMEEWRERDAANAAWVRDVFAAARSGAAPAVALFFQANPIGAGRDGREDDPGFELFLRTVEAEARAFGRPVLLVHADEHTYRMEPAVRLSAKREPLPNLTRLETFGGQDFHAVLVVVDPASKAVFAAGPLVVPGNPPPRLLRAPAPKS
jgi:hypothetical protein